MIHLNWQPIVLRDGTKIDGAIAFTPKCSLVVCRDGETGHGFEWEISILDRNYSLFSRDLNSETEPYATLAMATSACENYFRRRFVGRDHAEALR